MVLWWPTGQDTYRIFKQILISLNQSSRREAIGGGGGDVGCWIQNWASLVISSKESACNAGDVGLFPVLGRPPGGGHDNPLHYSCLETPMARGAWQATVHGVAKSWRWLKQLSTHTYSLYSVFRWVETEYICNFSINFFSFEVIFNSSILKVLTCCLRFL